MAKKMKKVTLNFSVADFTVKGATTRATTRATVASYNQKTRRFVLPLDVAEKSKAWELSGSASGADALMVKPAENGRALHPTQHFVTVPSNIAGNLKSKHYAYAEENGAYIFTPEAA